MDKVRVKMDTTVWRESQWSMKVWTVWVMIVECEHVEGRKEKSLTRSILNHNRFSKTAMRLNEE